MSDNRMIRSNTKFHPAWYLTLLVVPAVMALSFIGAGAWHEHQSNLARAQPSNPAQSHPSVSTTAPAPATALAPVVVSDAHTEKTTVR